MHAQTVTKLARLCQTREWKAFVKVSASNNDFCMGGWIGRWGGLRTSPREVQRFLEMVTNNPISNYAC